MDTADRTVSRCPGRGQGRGGSAGEGLRPLPTGCVLSSSASTCQNQNPAHDPADQTASEGRGRGPRRRPADDDDSRTVGLHPNGVRTGGLSPTGRPLPGGRSRPKQA